MIRIETDRLILRGWREADRAPFAALNADPEVMRHFPAPLSREESDAAMDRQTVRIARDGLGFLAMERRADGAFLGFAGLARVPFEAPFAPAVEIGWRLVRAHWGRGYATEAARACLARGFEAHGLPEIVSFTTRANLRSAAVMERLGMIRDPSGDFDHPQVPEGPLKRHILYRVTPPR